MTHPDHPTKKEMILEIARELAVPRFTPAEVEQIRRQLMARLGAAGKTSPDYIAGVLETAGMRIVWSTKADTEGQYEEEFQDLLHFATLEDAEKEEIMQWFKVWLETPDAFFDWLEVRKASADFQKRFAKSASADA